MSTSIKTEEYKDYRILIEQDDSPQNPREDYEANCLGKILYLPTCGYRLGDDQATVEEMQEIQDNPENICMPVFAYVHSEASLSLNRNYPFDCPWDSGQSGIIFTTREKASVWFPENYSDQKIKEIFALEIEAWNKYSAGDYYGYIVQKRCLSCKQWETVDSCWSYDDTDTALADAKAYIDVLSSEK